MGDRQPELSGVVQVGGQEPLFAGLESYQVSAAWQR